METERMALSQQERERLKIARSRTGHLKQVEAAGRLTFDASIRRLYISHNIEVSRRSGCFRSVIVLLTGSLAAHEWDRPENTHLLTFLATACRLLLRTNLLLLTVDPFR